jgi:predicted transcriptional regulator YdeE
MGEVVTKEFKLVCQENKGLFTDYGMLVPQAAQRFLQLAASIPLRGNEVTVYEPRRDEAHEEGTFFVGQSVDNKPASLPEGIEYMEVQHTYAMCRGKGSEMASLYSHLDQWIVDQSISRADQEQFILEVYYPVTGNEEEVEIYIPVK